MEVVPEALDLFLVDEHDGYYLRICKTCRGKLLGLLASWREDCISKRDIAKDTPITYEDVQLPEGRTCDKLRKEQKQLFFK